MVKRLQHISKFFMAFFWIFASIGLIAYGILFMYSAWKQLSQVAQEVAKLSPTKHRTVRTIEGERWEA